MLEIRMTWYDGTGEEPESWLLEIEGDGDAEGRVSVFLALSDPEKEALVATLAAAEK